MALAQFKLDHAMPRSQRRQPERMAVAFDKIVDKIA